MDDATAAKLGLPVLEPGWVWLAGAGPGDPGLITALGLQALRQADVMLHDALVDARLLTLAHGELIYAGKRAGVRSCKQDEISELLVRLAQEGKRVLRLKGGDPFVFGRGGEEAQALARAAYSLSHRAGRDGRHWRPGLCRHPRHPPRHQPCRHLHHRPWRGWQTDRAWTGRPCRAARRPWCCTWRANLRARSRMPCWRRGAAPMNPPPSSPMPRGPTRMCGHHIGRSGGGSGNRARLVPYRDRRECAAGRRTQLAGCNRLRRCGSSAVTAALRSAVMPAQSAISSRVRPQPRHRPQAGS